MTGLDVRSECDFLEWIQGTALFQPCQADLPMVLWEGTVMGDFSIYSFSLFCFFLFLVWSTHYSGYVLIA